MRKAILTLTCLAAAGAAFAEAHDPEQIRRTAERYAREHVQVPGGDARIEARGVDSRLRLAPCRGALEAFLPPGARLRGNTTVGVRCPQPRWQIFVPVVVTASAEVLVATRALRRGQSVGAADVRVERRDLATLPHGYVTDARELTGKQLARAVYPGAPITPDLLAAPALVQRGQTITVLGAAGGIEVRIEGQALEDGGAGDLIRVRNRSSGRVLQARVRSRGLVEVHR